MTDFQIPQGSKDDSTWQQVPLAFSVVAHSNLAILTRILHLLFRPRHAFCLYVDAKAEQEFKDAVRDLVECYRLAVNSLISETAACKVSFPFSPLKEALSRLPGVPCAVSQERVLGPHIDTAGRP